MSLLKLTALLTHKGWHAWPLSDREVVNFEWHAFMQLMTCSVGRLVAVHFLAVFIGSKCCCAGGCGTPTVTQDYVDLLLIFAPFWEWLRGFLESLTQVAHRLHRVVVLRILVLLGTQSLSAWCSRIVGCLVCKEGTLLSLYSASKLAWRCYVSAVGSRSVKFVWYVLRLPEVCSGFVECRAYELFLSEDTIGSIWIV